MPALGIIRTQEQKFQGGPLKFLPPIVWLTRLLVGAYPRWIGSAPKATQRIYFGNHTSHMDTVVLWAALPEELRSNTRPVAAKDYWDRPGIRGAIARKELNVVMVDRSREDPNADPLGPSPDYCVAVHLRPA